MYTDSDVEINEQDQFEGIEGLNLKAETLAKMMIEEAFDRLPHYIFYAGDTNLTFGIDDTRKYGLTKISRGKIVCLPKNYSYWDFWQGEQGGLIHHPDKTNRKNDVLREVRPGQIMRWLALNYGTTGLGHLLSIRGEENDAVIYSIGRALITRVPKTPKEIIRGVEWIEMLTQNIEKAQNEGHPLADRVQEVGSEMITAVETSLLWREENLANTKTEMENRRLPGGVGIAALDQISKRQIAYLGKTEADYAVDGVGFQEGIQRLIAQTGGSGTGAMNDALLKLLVGNQQMMMSLQTQLGEIISGTFGHKSSVEVNAKPAAKDAQKAEKPAKPLAPIPDQIAEAVEGIDDPSDKELAAIDAAASALYDKTNPKTAEKFEAGTELTPSAAWSAEAEGHNEALAADERRLTLLAAQKNAAAKGNKKEK